MNNVVPISTAIVPLREVQAEFALLNLGGEIRVVSLAEIEATLNGTREGSISMYKTADGKLLIMRFIETLAVSSKPAHVVEEFKHSPHTRVYDALAFSPLPTPAATLNFWVGSTVVPSKGDWSVIRDYLQEVVCDGDLKKFEYLLNFVAHMLQHPDKKPGVMLVLLGGEGTGKGTLFQLLNALWTRTSLLVSNIDDVVGQFNAAIERKFIIFMDEAMFSGDRKAQDRLKSMITEATVTVEQKYQPSRTIASYHRFIAASNHQHFAQVSSDDRRFLFLRVSEQRKKDYAYWAKVHRAIEDPLVISALAYDLSTRDLTDFNIRDRPGTVEHMEQKLRSLTGFERYWFEVLHDGSFGSDNNPRIILPWSGPCFVATAALVGGYKGDARGVQKYQSFQQQDVGRSLLKICPSAMVARRQVDGRQQRGFELPSLSAARAEFAAAMGGDVDWGDQDG